MQENNAKNYPAFKQPSDKEKEKKRKQSSAAPRHTRKRAHADAPVWPRGITICRALNKILSEEEEKKRNKKEAQTNVTNDGQLITH